MSKSIKKTVKLQNNEAFVVAPLQFWADMILLYRQYGDACSDSRFKDEWYSIADHLENWVDLTLAVLDE